MRTDHGLHAWLTIDDERALAEADAADARLAAARTEGAAAVDALHPLLGIPVALKDLVSVAGGQATAGSRILEGYRSPFDAHITERLHDAGAVILGKTNMDEFAMGSSTEHSAFGPTANPWDLGRVPGGSSGGSAAAVAAYHAPLGIGTDTGGSIRQPAALCGVVGHEADLRPRQPLRDRRVREQRSTRSGRSPATPATPPRCCTRSPAGTRATRPRRRSTVPDDLVHLPLPTTRRRRGCAAGGSGCRRSTSSRAWSRAWRRGSARRSPPSRQAGATVEEVSLPHTDYGLATYYIVAPAEASANLARYDGVRFGYSVRGGDDYLADYLATRGQGFGAEVKRRIMLGTYALSAGYYDAFYLKAQKVRTLIKRDFDRLWEQGFDALVAPTSATVAFPFGARMADPVSMYLSDACTLPVNMAGLPGVSIPCGLSEGLPVGLQLIGAAWSEAPLFRAARAYEAITADARLADHRAPRSPAPRRPGGPDARRADPGRRGRLIAAVRPAGVEATRRVGALWLWRCPISRATLCGGGNAHAQVRSHRRRRVVGTRHRRVRRRQAPVLHVGHRPDRGGADAPGRRPRA